MVLRALGLEDARNLAHAAEQVADKAQESICVAGEVLKSRG